MRSVLSVHWKDWCWSWNSNPLATWGEELTHLKRPWCREGLKVGREGDDRGWDGWMASPTQWTWVWVNSGSCWWTGRPGVLGFMGPQWVGHDGVTELDWNIKKKNSFLWTWIIYYIYFLKSLYWVWEGEGSLHRGLEDLEKDPPGNWLTTLSSTDQTV